MSTDLLIKALSNNTPAQVIELIGNTDMSPLLDDQSFIYNLAMNNGLPYFDNIIISMLSDIPSLIRQAAKANDKRILDYWISRCVQDLDYNILIGASQSGNIDLLDTIIGKIQYNPNSGRYVSDAISAAILSNSLNTIKYFVTVLGVDISIDKINYAVSLEKKDIVTYLLGVLPNMANTVLLQASRSDNVDMIELALSHNANDIGEAISNAIISNSLDVLKHLILKFGINRDVVIRQAMKLGNTYIVDSLRQ